MHGNHWNTQGTYRFYIGTDSKNNRQNNISIKNNLETKYWYFYSDNSVTEKEGHFKKGQKNDWWLFYDKNGNVNHKCQLKNNQKNGYCLLYQKKKLVKASKFKEGKKIKEWKDFSSFKKENNLLDLR